MSDDESQFEVGGVTFETTEFEVHMSEDGEKVVNLRNSTENLGIIDDIQLPESDLIEVNDRVETFEVLPLRDTENLGNGVTANSDRKKKTLVDELYHLPVSRIKTIIKADPEVQNVSSRALFVMTKATELFVQWFGKELKTFTGKQKKQSADKNDVHTVINCDEKMEFLDGAVD